MHNDQQKANWVYKTACCGLSYTYPAYGQDEV